MYLTVDVALHGHEEAVKLLVVPKGALTCQLGIQVILRASAISACSSPRAPVWALN